MSFIGLSLASSAFALTISPAKLEISGDPGTTISDQFELFNEQQDAKTLYSSFANFESSGESGAPHFIKSNDGLATWIKTDNKITLTPGERKKISFSITIPKNAEPGGHFAAIFWGSQPSDSQSGGEVSIGSKLGILVLLRVTGDVKEGGGLLGFNTKNNQRFFTATPVSFEYRLNNTGGDRMVPRGDIKIRNLFVFPPTTFLANKKEGSVLPGSVRKFEVLWGEEPPDGNKAKAPGFFGMALKELKDFHFGWYSANVSLTFGENNQTASESFSFFVIPWQLLTIILIVLGIVFFLATFGLKKYNKWIISKAIGR